MWDVPALATLLLPLSACLLLPAKKTSMLVLGVELTGRHVPLPGFNFSMREGGEGNTGQEGPQIAIVQEDLVFVFETASH